MDEERNIEDLGEEEEYEDLDAMDEFNLDMEEVSDIEGLEEIPEEEEVGIAESDIIITYEDKIVDETQELEKHYNELLEQVKQGEVLSVIERASELLSVGKRLDAHYLTAKISSLVASLLSSEQKHNEATEYYLQAVSEARKSEDKKLHLLSLSAFGNNLKNFDLKDAAVVFNQARELANELGEREYFAENSVELANCLFKTEQDHSYSLYQENIDFFENQSDYRIISQVRYKMGLINITKNDYNLALQNLTKARDSANNVSDLAEGEDIIDALNYIRFQLKKGRAILHSLKLPQPEPLGDTPGTKKIFEIYASTGVVDIIKKIAKKRLKLISDETTKINELEFLCDENKIARLNDADLLEYSKLYEEIGDTYYKENSFNSSFYNYLCSLMLSFHIGNNKRADKLEKKFERTTQDITDNAEDDTLIFSMMMYKYYQLAHLLREKNQKYTISLANQGLEIASKRNNTYYEGLFKEIVADVKSLSDQNKAFSEYQAAVSLYTELEDYLDLMRVYEKIGNIFLFTQTEKAKEYLNKALEIARDLEDSDIISRLEGKL